MRGGGRARGTVLWGSATVAVGGLILVGGILIATSAAAIGSVAPVGVLAATAGAFLIVSGLGRFEGWTWWAGTIGLILASLAAILRGGLFVLTGVATLFLVAYGLATRAGWLGPARR